PLELVMERLASDEIAIAHSALRSGRHGDHAVANGQRVGGNAEMLRCALDEQAARFGGGVPGRHPAALDAGAARAAALIAGERGVAHDHGHALERDVELVGDDLADRDVDALAHVHLAEEGGDPTVGTDRDPGVELIRRERRFRGVAPGLTDHTTGDREADDEGAARLQEIASRDREEGHGRPLMLACRPRAWSRAGWPGAVRSGT